MIDIKNKKALEKFNGDPPDPPLNEMAIQPWAGTGSENAEITATHSRTLFGCMQQMPGMVCYLLKFFRLHKEGRT